MVSYFYQERMLSAMVSIVQRHIMPSLISYVLESTIKGCYMKVAFYCRKYISNPILVVCSGAGGQCFNINKLNKKSIGIDININLIILSKKRYPDIPFVCCDASKLPFKDKIFKGVTFTFALHDKSAQLRDRFIVEAKRVSAIGCFFIVTDIGLPKKPIEKIGHMITILTELFSGHYSTGMDFLKSGAIENVASTQNMRIVYRFKNGLRNSESVILQKL
jgi:ubiquinone/menaquinone biosynthesis C-methylase UbiE